MDFKDALLRGEDSPLLTLPIHELIRQMQNENGLKHHDHVRYCHFLSRKLARVRKALGLGLNFNVTGTGNGKSGGRGNNNKTRPVNTESFFSPELVTSSTFLMVPLLYAERAWSTAASKKDALAQSGKQQLRHSELSRLSKAVKWARTLEAMCQAVPLCDPHTTLEAAAYASCLDGQLLLEKEQWAGAVAELSKARSIYDELCRAASVGSGSGADLEQRDLFSERLAIAVLPSLRFCKYNLSGEQEGLDQDMGQEEGGDLEVALAHDPDLFAKLQHLRSKRRADSADLGTTTSSSDHQYSEGTQGGSCGSGVSGIGLAAGRVKWCGRRVWSSEDLKPSLLEVETAFETLQSQQSAHTGAPSTAHTVALENCLSALDAASRRVSDLLLKAGRGGATSSSSGDAKASLQHLQHYLKFRQLGCFSLRHLALASACTAASDSGDGSKWTHAQELAHLYLQLGLTAGEMTTLVEAAAASVRGGGQDNGGEGGGEEEDVLTLRLRSEQTLYRASRLVALADCYALAPLTGDAGVDCSGPGGRTSCVEGSKPDMMGKATALLELADELMSSSVYDNVDNFAQAVGSMESAAEGDWATAQEELQRQQSQVASLETTISGAKLRYAAYLYLFESKQPSSSGVRGRNLIDFTESNGDPHRVSAKSILQNKFDWVASPTSLSATGCGGVAAVHGSRTDVHKSKDKSSILGLGSNAAQSLHVCSIPPSFAPIPCKPVFYDVALNHLDLTEAGSQVSMDIDRRCGLQIKATASAAKSKTAEPDEKGQTDPSTSTTLVGAAAQSIYGWWSGDK